MEIKRYDDKYLDSLNELLKLCFNVQKKGNVNSDDVELVALIDNRVVGYLVLNRLKDGISDESYYYVNYVCTHPDYRNQHISTKMFDEVFSICKREGISYLELTSKPSRVAAHHLYHKLGFQVRETTVFRKEIL